jgi:hypothetical protein
MMASGGEALAMRRMFGRGGGNHGQSSTLQLQRRQLTPRGIVVDEEHDRRADRRAIHL